MKSKMVECDESRVNAKDTSLYILQTCLVQEKDILILVIAWISTIKNLSLNRFVFFLIPQVIRIKLESLMCNLLFFFFDQVKTFRKNYIVIVLILLSLHQDFGHILNSVSKYTVILPLLVFTHGSTMVVFHQHFFREIVR